MNTRLGTKRKDNTNVDPLMEENKLLVGVGLTNLAEIGFLVDIERDPMRDAGRHVCKERYLLSSVGAHVQSLGLHAGRCIDEMRWLLAKPVVVVAPHSTLLFHRNEYNRILQYTQVQYVYVLLYRMSYCA